MGCISLARSATRRHAWLYLRCRQPTDGRRDGEHELRRLRAAGQLNRHTDHHSLHPGIWSRRDPGQLHRHGLHAGTVLAVGRARQPGRHRQRLHRRQHLRRIRQSRLGQRGAVPVHGATVAAELRDLPLQGARLCAGTGAVYAGRPAGIPGRDEPLRLCWERPGELHRSFGIRRGRHSLCQGKRVRELPCRWMRALYRVAEMAA